MTAVRKPARTVAKNRPDATKRAPPAGRNRRGGKASRAAAGDDTKITALKLRPAKLTVEPWMVEDADRERLRRAGFSDRDIWDIAAVAAFYNMTNRLTSATDMRPNSQYHAQAR